MHGPKWQLYLQELVILGHPNSKLWSIHLVICREANVICPAWTWTSKVMFQLAYPYSNRSQIFSAIKANTRILYNLRANNERFQTTNLRQPIEDYYSSILVQFKSIYDLTLCNLQTRTELVLTLLTQKGKANQKLRSADSD